MKPLMMLLFILFFSSCVSPGDLMQSYVGKTQAELVGDWGTPLKTESDGKGGEIWTYRQRVFPDQLPSYQNTAIGGGYNYTIPQERANERYRQFLLDDHGLVYAWRWWD